MKFLSSSLLMLATGVAVAAADKTTKKSPPPFFLQDPKDSLCLGGEDFRRCSIDTLFYVTGNPGSYQIHKRPADGLPASSEDDGLCLSKKTCNESDQDARILSCSHCGSKEWNILGDSDTGYVLTEGAEGKKVVFGATGRKSRHAGIL